MTGQWAFVGCRYCPIERITHPAARSSRMTVRTSSKVSPRPTMSPDLVTAPWLAAASSTATDRWYFPCGRTEGNRRGTVSILWLRMSGLAARTVILNHNIETVPRLFPSVRPQGKYQRSVAVLEAAASHGAVTKSGLMVGLGETFEEVRTVMRELRAAGCVILSIGQYLQPTKAHWPVMRFYPPAEFLLLKEEGLALGFRHVESGPLVRSSYHAAEGALLGAN